MNNEIRKNVEGYTDPTAAPTLSKKEPGDIWAYKDGECLIIKGHSGFATILRLHDRDQYGDRVKVADRDDGPAYVDPAFLITGRYSDMGKYVETLDVETFTQVIRAVEDAAGLHLLAATDANTGHKEEAPTHEAAQLQEELEAAQRRVEILEAHLGFKKAEIDAANNTAKKAKDQLELLRDMYDALLQTVLNSQN